LHAGARHRQRAGRAVARIEGRDESGSPLAPRKSAGGPPHPATRVGDLHGSVRFKGPARGAPTAHGLVGCCRSEHMRRTERHEAAEIARSSARAAPLASIVPVAASILREELPSLASGTAAWAPPMVKSGTPGE